MREVLRQEKKYLMTYGQFRSLDGILSSLLHVDENGGKDGYMVRSLYFDTLQERDYYEKEDGLEIRRKIRLRIYDPAADFALLEMKQKQGEYQKKRSLRVSREDAKELISGRYESLLKYEEEFAAECYGLMKMMQYRPKSVVEYRRKAYIAKENKTRITFDYEIKATESNLDIFSGSLLQYPVLEPYLVVLEVKYNGFLLSYLKNLLSLNGQSPTSVSKYGLSRTVGLYNKF